MFYLMGLQSGCDFSRNRRSHLKLDLSVDWEGSVQSTVVTPDSCVVTMGKGSCSVDDC